MAKPPFGALSGALAALGTALIFLAVELRADGYERYVTSVSTAAGAIYIAAALVVVTWIRARRTRSD
ncbi:MULTISPECIES: SCO3870 family protein [unclassified Streptomyces]|uniref:SCO3870 family protein n=1 Tax=unclassified Streptomyces TaxID=2593676 RepID=UPI002DDBE3B7|nr:MULTISPECIES: SCO3870 family protein [unclassified Streptomyces]WSA96857.1 SCO3870 family protein [Streptomyces sp. NBC_01795]WSB81273.1 SCO3870 family protein [Streptomyces sp. NBC_01775]WSS39213.1 SCO3870 family protein [Streptomyces sp. NBC_01187]